MHPVHSLEVHFLFWFVILTQGPILALASLQKELSVIHVYTVSPTVN